MGWISALILVDVRILVTTQALEGLQLSETALVFDGFLRLARPPVNWDVDMENPMVFRKMIYCIYECLVSLISKYLLIYTVYWREELARTEVSQETIERNPPKTRTPRSPCVGSGWSELLAAQSTDKVGQGRNQAWNNMEHNPRQGRSRNKWSVTFPWFKSQM